KLISQRQGQMLGTEFLSSKRRRTIVGTAPALCAGVEVQDVFPAEVLNVTVADARWPLRFFVLSRGLNLLKKGLRILRHRAQSTRSTLVTEVDIRNRGDDVKMLRIRKNVEKNQHQGGVRPKSDL